MLPFEQLTIAMIKNIISEHKKFAQSARNLDDMCTEKNKQIEALRKENIGLKDDKKAMSQIMDERAEQSAQTVRDLNETIDKLKSQNGTLREDLYLQELKLSLSEDPKQEAPEQDDERVLIGTEFIDNDKAWENFKASKDKLWKSCFFECNEFGFYPKNIQYWEWSVRNEDGDIIAQGDKKPKKQDIFANWRNGITIRLYAFNDREEYTLITFFDGHEWSYEEAVE